MEGQFILPLGYHTKTGTCVNCHKGEQSATVYPKQ